MKKKLLSMILVTSIAMQAFCTPAMAAASKIYIKRDHPQIGYIKSTLYWEHTKDKVTSSSATQSSSGVFVDELGTKRKSKKEKCHRWECKSMFYLGLNLPVGTFGYKKTWSDIVNVKNAGNYNIEWDD